MHVGLLPVLAGSFHRTYPGAAMGDGRFRPGTALGEPRTQRLGIRLGTSCIENSGFIYEHFLESSIRAAHGFRLGYSRRYMRVPLGAIRAERDIR